MGLQLFGTSSSGVEKAIAGNAGEAGKVLKADDPVVKALAGASGKAGQRRLYLLESGLLEWTSDGLGIPVTAFGAKWDGVTDDAPAVQKAISVSAELFGIPVLLPEGMGVFKSTPELPKNKSFSIPIRGAGKFATTIKLEGIYEAFQYVAAGAGDTVGKIHFEGFTVDGNNLQVGANKTRPVVIGCFHNASLQEQVNVKDVTIRHVRVINVPTLEAKENGRRGVVFTPFHSKPGLAKNVVENIQVEDFECLGGQYAVFLGAAAAGGVKLPANVYMAHIHISDIKYVGPNVPAAFGYCAGVQLGESAWSDGKNIVVERVYSENSADVGVELDVPCTARDIGVVNSNDAGLLFNTFNPATTQDPIVTQLTAEAALGATVINVTSSASFSVGERIVFHGAEQEVSTIKAKGEGTIELTEATTIKHANAGWVQQVDDMAAVRWRVDNYRYTRTANMPGSQGGIAIQNVANVIPCPAIEIEGYLYKRTVAGLPAAQGEVIRGQWGTATNTAGEPRAVKIRKLQAEIANLEHTAATKQGYAAVYMTMQGLHFPFDLQGEINISGAGVTGGGQIPANLVNIQGSAIYDVDLIIKAVLGSTGGEPLRSVTYNQESKIGDLGGRTRLRIRPSSIGAGGGSVLGVRYGKGHGFAQRTGSTTTAAKVLAGATEIPVASSAGFSVGDAIVVDSLSAAKSEVLVIKEVAEGKLVVLAAGEATGTANEHEAGATVSKLNQNTIVDSDLSGVGPEGTAFATEDSKIRMRMLSKNVRWEKQQGVKTLTLPVSGKLIQILEPGQSGKVFVEGGTVSAVEYSSTGTAFWKLASATGVVFSVNPGDFIKVTYTVAPTIKFVADRT